MNAMDEKMYPWSTPLAMSNGSESVIVPSGCLRRTTVAAVQVACTMRRTLAPTHAVDNTKELLYIKRNTS